MLQVFLPPHVPDVTDVGLCTLGAAGGMLVTLRLQAHTQRHGTGQAAFAAVDNTAVQRQHQR
jgi:hypothetical protein